MGAYGAPAMALQVDVTSNQVTITPPEEIDIANCDVLASQIERACAMRPSTIAVDFRNVAFCDSTSVVVLLSALEKLEAQGCRLVIRNPCALLRRVATALGESERLGIRGSPPRGRPVGGVLRHEESAASCRRATATLRHMTQGVSAGGERRVSVVGVVLLVLAALSWAATYGPPGTMTSIALAAMAAFALAGAGVVVLLVALVLHLRR